MLSRFSPPPPPPTQPHENSAVLPHYPVKAAVIGKKFCGKSTVVRKLAANHRIVPICIDEILQEALDEAKASEEPPASPATSSEHPDNGSSEFCLRLLLSLVKRFRGCQVVTLEWIVRLFWFLLFAEPPSGMII